ncbi:hypothetical protein [Natronococcus occultus]|uniref:Uncharacterized protein n=1 Tax=Natronococcus occultus SP4 TaxID=694430 RepID=L0JZ17_9EURY|nr:hypothetical protein [Natronococcus occultus]AGB37118.1 hypothetical protein Natoc_1296 [Natronococcus occultus SP4]
MADDTSDGTRTALRKHPLVSSGTSVLRYGVSVAFLALIVAEIGLDASTWFSAQIVAGLLGGVVLVGVLRFVFERTTFGRSADQAFRQHRLFGTLLVVVLVSVGGIAVSSALEGIPRLFSLAVALGLFCGLLLLEGIADYRQ